MPLWRRWGWAIRPRSIRPGRAARRVLEEAREAVARFFAARPADVIFCSGATEANALAVHALAAGRPVLVGATEHDAVRAAAPDAAVVPVLADGTVDLPALEALLAAHPGALVCLMAANNETGVLHDIAAPGAICNAAWRVAACRCRAGGWALQPGLARAGGGELCDLRA